jgi:hypothetical protein
MVQVARSLPRRWLYGATLVSAWHEHGVALLFYAALSIALSWPTARDFTTRITSSGVDARHNLWLFWHTQQVLLGQQSLFDAPLLYYPRGISLLVHGVGPITGLFALPFWAWGPEAAYNGALLLSLWLSGYCTYRLARGLELGRAPALFAGIMVIAAPMGLAGLNNHVTKVFVGTLPLLLLALQRALDLRRSWWWAPATGLALLLVLLHNGYQFVFAALAIGFFVLAALLTAPKEQRWPLLLRAMLIGMCVLVIVGPLVFAIERAASNPAIIVDVNQDSFAAPDLIQLILPPHFSLLFGSFTQQIMQTYSPDTTLNSESAVSLSLIGLALGLLAWVVGARRAEPHWRAGRRWFALAVLCVLFALGPQLRAAGNTSFTEYELPIILPYAFLTGLPGLDFMRAPGRFMMFGFVVFAISASYGLAWLTQRLPRLRYIIVPVAIALVLLEAWPAPFPQETLVPMPQFYQQIASDREQYGVFDLPLKSSGSLSWNWTTAYFSSYYQIFQMTHHKGIAAGYISRTYGQHPVFADIVSDAVQQLRIDGQPAAHVNFQPTLARNNYRYAVLHKTLFSDLPQGDPANLAESQALLAAAFGAQPPIVDDDLVKVYQVDPNIEQIELRWGQNWSFLDNEAQARWAVSPATLEVVASDARPAVLQITPAFIHDPQSEGGLGAGGILNIQVGASFSTSVAITAGQPTSVPIALTTGSQAITLTLQAGNFQPSQYGKKETRRLSFAVTAIDLQSAEQIARPPDILVDGRPQQTSGAQIIATAGAGWYQLEADNQGRWFKSPSELLVYSFTKQQVQLELRAKTLYDGANGLTDRGTILVTIRDQPPQRALARPGQPIRANVELRPGWNSIKLALEAGNFQPNQLFPGNGDQRQLSFKLNRLDIRTK